MTPKSLQAALQASPRGAEAETLAAQAREYFGKDISDLSKGPAPKIDELTVAWAIEIPDAGAAPRVVSSDAKLLLPLNRIGSTNVYAAVVEFSWGAACKWQYEIGDRKIGGGNLEVYTTPPEARKQPSVPESKLIQQPKWTSKIFEGTTRDWWIYTNIASGPTLRAGGHNYPALIRKTPKKPIRVFLQDGENDLDNQRGSWPLANRQMAGSLAFAKYDFSFEWGNGFHMCQITAARRSITS